MKRPADFAIALRTTNPSEAEIVRALLEDAGLYALIPDRNTPLPIDLRPLDGEYSLTACDVVVRTGDLAQAKEIIEEARAAGELEDEGDKEDDELDGEGEDEEDTFKDDE